METGQSTRTRTGRKSVPPKRYEPVERPEDDSDGSGGDDMTDQEETVSEDSGTTGSLAGFLTSDDEPGSDSDAGDPDWEMDSADTGSTGTRGCATDQEDDDSDID